MNETAPLLPFNESPSTVEPTSAPARGAGLPDAPGQHGQPGRKTRRRRKPELGDVPYAKGSDTSAATAHSLRSIASDLSRTILGFVTEAGEHGLTAEEAGLLLAQKRGADPYVFNARQTAASRLNLLKDIGLVVDSGKRRLTASRRPAIVHVLPKYGPPPAPPEQPGGDQAGKVSP